MMSISLRFGSALSAIALASMAGCASPRNSTQSASSLANKFDKSKLGLATRAHMALASQDFVTAIGLAERAVEASPQEASLRALLGNTYFASGRFASAESAYRDSLSLSSNQPQVILKLILVDIAQGKIPQAMEFLQAGQRLLDAPDYGLAMALAGQPAEAVRILDGAARQVGADSRVRQNLALALALSGDWSAARTVAAQDLTADLVDARIEQWMALAKPGRVSDQVASLVGVTPAAADPGQPVRLALVSPDTRFAEATPAPTPAPQAMAAVEAAPQPVGIAVASVPPKVEPAAPQFAPEPPFVEVPAKLSSTATVALPAPRPAPVLRAASAKPRALPVRAASLLKARGNSTAVVQLGAYASPERVAAAWNNAARRFASLRGFSPVSARFNGPSGTVYRLSVKGFANASEAGSLCASLRRSGATCFVRSVAGDAPVRIAAR